MVAFRKLFPALTVATLMFGATSAMAQAVGGNPLQCTANSGVPPIVRAEGFTELVGDIVISCTGGNPATIQPTVNFQVFLNTAITSRLLSNIGSDVTEALLMIDEPGLERTDINGGINPPGTPLAAPYTTPYCVSPGPGSNSAQGVACNIPNALATYQQNTYTVFRGARQAGASATALTNTVVWQGVPVVPPGSNRTRTFRITNIRANAAALGVSQTLIPTQIVAFLSVFPQGTLPIDNPQQIVGYVQSGILFDVRNCQNTGGAGSGGQTNVCRSVSADRFDDPNSGSLPSNSANAETIFGLRFREGFQTAFKPRIVVDPTDPTINQFNSIPGQVYNSESGFVQAGTGNAGIADAGTRVAARFVNVPTGVRIFVGTTSAPASSGASAVLVATDANGASAVAGGGGNSTSPPSISGPVTINCPAFSATAATSGVEVPITAGSGVAVWEVISSGTGSNDTLFFYVGYAFRSNPSGALPTLGQSAVIGSFAPFYAAAGATPDPNSISSGLAIPRFTASTTQSNLFRINSCQTNLLFPYITNFAGFDTGIAIANTSQDPFSSPNDRLNSGPCTMFYYGRLANGNPPTTLRETTDRAVAAGETLTFILSGGGTFGLRGNPNFQGYMIAQCEFLYAHGFAFITDGPIGQARVAEGYLALVLDGVDSSGRLRGNTLGEVRGH